MPGNVLRNLPLKLGTLENCRRFRRGEEGRCIPLFLPNTVCDIKFLCLEDATKGFAKLPGFPLQKSFYYILAMIVQKLAGGGGG